MARHTDFPRLVAGALLAAGLALSASAGDLDAGPVTPPIHYPQTSPNRAPNLDIPLSVLDYYRLGSNGLMEYGFTTPLEMSPAPSHFPRPAAIVASAFLAANAQGLDIRQDISDFRPVSTEDLCDGSQRVTFAQTYDGIPVEGSFLSVTVQEQVVKYLAVRIVEDVSTLPACRPAPGSGSDVRFVVQNGQSVIIVSTIEQLQRGNREVQRDLCTSLVLSWVVHLR